MSKAVLSNRSKKTQVKEPSKKACVDCPKSCEIQKLSLNELFIYNGRLFALLTTPVSEIAESGTYDWNKGILTARTLATSREVDGVQTWYGLSKNVTEDFKLDTIVDRFCLCNRVM